MENEISTPVVGSVNYVYDETNSLSETDFKELNDYLSRISYQNHFDIVAVIVNDTGRLTPMEYADDFYDYNGFSEDGCLFLLSLKDRDW